MAKTMQNYFRENFDGTETGNVYPSESFPVYGSLAILASCNQLLLTSILLIMPV